MFPVPVPCGSTSILRSYENTFVRNENKNNNLFNNSSPPSYRLLPFWRVPRCSALSPERNQCCLRSACVHFLQNVNNANYVDYTLVKSAHASRYSPKWLKMVTKSLSSFAKLKLDHWCHMAYFNNRLRLWALIVLVSLLSIEGQRALRFHQKYLNLCSEDEQRSYGFGTI